MSYDALASLDSVQKAIAALAERNVVATVVERGEEALKKIQDLIPSGASVMNGSSRTLEAIGFVEYLKSGQHGWNNLHETVLLEQNQEKKSALRKQAVLSDFYLGSVHAVAETGEMLIASNSGSQLPHLVYTSPNIILVVGTQKIVPNVDAAMRRVYDYVLPLEDRRMKEVGGNGSAVSKLLLFAREPAFTGRKVHIIFVSERLGF